MTEATVFQAVQIGVESTHGTAVACPLILPSLMLDYSPQGTTKKYRPTGRKTPRGYYPGAEHTEANISGGLSYNEIVYLLSSLINYAAPARNIADTGLSYTWQFEWDDDGEDTFKSYTVELGGAGQAREFPYGVVSEMDITFRKDELSLSGKMIGQEATEGITKTAGAADVAHVPILPTQCTLYIANTYAGLPGSAFEHAFEAKWSLKNRRGPAFTLNAAEPSFTTVVEREPEMTLELLLEANEAGIETMKTAYAASTTKFVRILCEGATIETTYKYTLQIDMAGQMTALPSLADEDGVYAARWTMGLAHDTTWGQGFEIRAINTIASIAPA